MEQEASTSTRIDLRSLADQKKASFTKINIPNLKYVGWRGWWQRMEAECWREQTKHVR